jgi:hypothetical protein
VAVLTERAVVESSASAAGRAWGNGEKNAWAFFSLFVFAMYAYYMEALSVSQQGKFLSYP